jgi:dTDP-4-amino-4,6-dideoxygalactose transaminase
LTCRPLSAPQAEIDDQVLRVLDSVQFIMGPAVSSFEDSFAKYSHVSDAIGVNSGTSALPLAVLAVGVGPGDEVITVPYTFVATVAAIDYAGARPVFVDIEPEYWTMDPKQLESALTSRTKAIIPVHLTGSPPTSIRFSISRERMGSLSSRMRVRLTARTTKAGVAVRWGYRMDGIQGAILGVKLRFLEEWIEARQRNAQTYKDLLSDVAVRLPAER